MTRAIHSDRTQHVVFVLCVLLATAISLLLRLGEPIPNALGMLVGYWARGWFR
jgi:hypothetical protein